MKLNYKLLFFVFFVLNNINSQSCIQLNSNYFSCGVPSQEFVYFRAQPMPESAQIQSNWCWAACIQMILNYHGLYVNQHELVNRVCGNYVDMPANQDQILTALTGFATDFRGRSSNIHAYAGPVDVNEIVTGLSRKWPLIVGLRNPYGGIGHAYVLTAIEYSNHYDHYGNVIGYIPHKVILRDPAPRVPERVELSWNEFYQRCITCIRVWVTRN